jgi:uncharacterized membrane protein YbaN (DUF454 family)
MRESLVKFLWRGLAFVGLFLAIIGAILPVMPTTPFLILSAWAASKGWPPLEAWLLDHAMFGKPIRDWRSHRAVPPRAKQFTAVCMLGSSIMLQFTPLPQEIEWARWAVPFIFAAFLAWFYHLPSA